MLSDCETEATATTSNEETKTTETKDEVKENNNTSQTTPTNTTETKDNTKTESTNTTETNNTNTNTEATTPQNNASNSGGNSETKTTEKEKEVKPFVANDLIVKQTSKPSRMAKTGETLYFVNTPILTDARVIDFELKIKPNLDEKLIPKENIKWSLSQKELTSYAGKKIVPKIPINDKIDAFTITSTAGYPSTIDKSVDVKWVDENYSSNNLAIDMPKITKLKESLEELARYTGTRIYNKKNQPKGDSDNGILFDVSYQNEFRNLENTKDRLYYKETKNTVKLEVGAKINYETPLPNLAIPSIDRMLFGYKVKVELGLYWFIGAKASAEIGMTKTSQEWIEISKLDKSEWIYGEPSTIVIEGTTGLDPKAVIKITGISAEASAKASVKLKILEYDFKTGEKKDPLREGIKLECTPITKLDIFGLSWSHEWGKYEHTVKIN